MTNACDSKITNKKATNEGIESKLNKERKIGKEKKFPEILKMEIKKSSQTKNIDMV